MQLKNAQKPIQKIYLLPTTKHCTIKPTKDKEHENRYF